MHTIHMAIVGMELLLSQMLMVIVFLQHGLVVVLAVVQLQHLIYVLVQIVLSLF